jgi:hypothetical protein
MYLDETGLTREGNTTTTTTTTTTSTSQELNISQEYRLFMESLNNEQVMLEDDRWQEQVYEVCLTSIFITIDNQITIDMHNLIIYTTG